jgi:putative acetyltransferase
VTAPSIRPYRAADLEPLVVLWNRTKRDAYPYLPAEQTRTVDEDRAFFTTSILTRCRVWVCEEGGTLLGFLAMTDGYVDRLYVAPEHQRRGVGTLLLGQAFREAPDTIDLHTHQANVAARTFYEKHGFVAVEFGVSPPPESAPDVRYRRGS